MAKQLGLVFGMETALSQASCGSELRCWSLATDKLVNETMQHKLCWKRC